MSNQTEVKQLIGALNLDDPISVLGKGFHIDARNVEFDGTPPNRRVKTKAGNFIKTNALLPATGVNKTICRKYDPITRRIYFLNYNSTGKHGIYYYDTIGAFFLRLVEVGINTTGDPLQFTADSHTNIDIIYGDSTQGNILYWVDSLGRPSKININRAIASGYGSIQRSFLDVAKEPADIPPYVVYESDAANTVNNLRKQLFRVKVRWVFDDQDKSVTSSQSIMPIPVYAYDQEATNSPTANCRLAITYQTGATNVKKIEILVANSLGNVMSDFYLVASIDKAAESIPSNDVATYLFYNDKGYNNILVDESIQLYDYVPDVTEAQTLLNGNVLSYGNITEGRPNLTNFKFGSDTSIVSSGQSVYYSSIYFTNLIAAQDGKSGYGSGDIHIVVRGVVISPGFSLDTYFVRMTDGSNISYTLTAGDDAAAVIEGLRVDALAQGYTIISAGTNDLYVTKTSMSLAGVLITSDYAYNPLINGPYNAYDWSSKYGLGLVYFDQKGRTNGAVFTNGFSVNTIPYAETGPFVPYTPKLTATIYHQPPDWAYYFQWVRTKNLSKSKIQQWISDRTFKDTAVLAGLIKYAYISIESLNAFVLANPGSPLGYGFTAGDRIRFFKRYNPDGTTANLYGNAKDFEIVASVTNPEVNGEVKSGQFVKIILPTVDGTFDFGTDGFANYFIEMYTPAQSVAGGLELYYEFGERYAIGNPTLSSRFHQGMLQTQTSNYSLPATYEFTKGDFYIRNRSVQTGNVYTWNIVGGSLTAGRILFGLNFIGSTYADPNITSQNVTLTNISGNTPSGGISPGSDTRWFQKAILNTTFRTRLSISLNFTTAVVGDTWRIFWLNRFNEREYIGTMNNSAAGTYTINVDASKTLEDDRVFLIAEGQERPVVVLSSQMTWSVDRVIEQRMIDQNFSDYFPSIVNSNGRSFLYDQNANRVNYANMYRWSLAYQENTNINKTSRFYPENFDTTDRSKGGIKKLASMDQRLIFFLERKVGWTAVLGKTIANSDGNPQLITTDVIITPNNVQYYNGEFGVGNQPTSVVQSGFVYYFVDPVKCKILRLSMDGITDLAETYKVQTWANQNLPKYLNPGTYAFGGSQKVLGTYNVRPDNIGEYLLLAQGTTGTSGEVFPFEEKYNSFYGAFDGDSDCIVCGENTLYYFRNGQLWQSGPSGPTYCNFFNVQKLASITLPFNDQMVIKKVYNAIAYEANQTWGSTTVGDIRTDTVNSQTFLTQQSKIFVQDYDILENPSRYAAFNKDVNSMTDPDIALWEGDVLNGRYIVCKLTASSTGFCYLFAPYIKWQPDARNL